LQQAQKNLARDEERLKRYYAIPSELKKIEDERATIM
jgi:hypothetical protein